MTAKISDLSADDARCLDVQRELIFKKAGKYRENFQTIEIKIFMLDEIIRTGAIKKDNAWELQSLGIVFGDAIAQQCDLEWKIVEDEYGRDPALIAKGSSLKIFPLTMISKRIERGDGIDVVEFFGKACGHIMELKKKLK